MEKIIKIRQSYEDYEIAMLIENNNKLIDIIDELQSKIDGLCKINESFISIIEQMKRKQNTMENDIRKLCENQNCIDYNVVVKEPSISDEDYRKFVNALRRGMSDKNFRYLNII